MVARFAVIGNPIEHSLSPIIHQFFAEQVNIHLVYEKIKADEASFAMQVSNFFRQDGKGLNITLPFKQKAFAQAHYATPRCNLAGAANTLWMSNNQLHADNTDGIGLLRDLRHYICLSGIRVLILGAGGAVRGILQSLMEHNLRDLVITNRTLAKAKALQQIVAGIHCVRLDELKGEFNLVINATSASLANELIVLPPEIFAAKPLCYDLSYGVQKNNSFGHYATDLGCDAVDGLGMLVEQAAEAFFKWHGIMPDVQSTLKFLREFMQKNLKQP